MKKSAQGEAGRKAAAGQLWLHLPGMVRKALYEAVIGAGLACEDEVLEREGEYPSSAGYSPKNEPPLTRSFLFHF